MDRIPAGRWRAANDQARTIAGNLHVAPPEAGSDIVSLAFGQGITVRARPATLPAEDADVRTRLDQARKLLGAGPADFPTHFTVIQETVAMSAPQGGLCGGLRTRMLAVVGMVDPEGRRLLRLAAFHGPPPGQPMAGELPACFTYDFVQDR
ncbi:MAG: hypothetical protein NW200_11985 [Hyphomonadaceae bacterium]|nr:hypothetical protein [Hyphomonadaceae bacterium]